MNNIDTKLTQLDRIDARGKSAAAIAAEILDDLQKTNVYDTPLGFDHTTATPLELQNVMRERFELWVNSWIAPRCRQIIAKQTP